jgi:hypothetical protein
MKVELSQAGFTPVGLASMAILIAMIEMLAVAEQRLVLARAATLVDEGPGTRRDVARRMIGAMYAQIGA